MILSRRHRFVLLRGRKVGGTSVEIALSTICGPEDIVTPLVPVDERARQRLGGHCGNYSASPRDEQAYRQLVAETPVERLAALKPPRGRYVPHMSLRRLAAAFGEPLDGYRLRCVVRNPYARVISALNMARGFRAYKVGADMAGATEGLARDFDALGPKALASLPNIDLYRDESGAVAALPLRYEQLEADLAGFLGELGVAPRVALPHAKKGLLSNRLDPRVIFRRDQLDTINRLFAEEFDAFGYARV